MTARGGTTSAATALANPFANVMAASAAIRTLDGANLSRGEVVITAGPTVVHADFSFRAIGATPLIIRGEDRGKSI